MRSAILMHPVLGLLVLSFGCTREEPISGAEELRSTTSDFNVYWPPKDPEQAVEKSVKPLLKGTLGVVAEAQPRGPTSSCCTSARRRALPEASSRSG